MTNFNFIWNLQNELLKYQNDVEENFKEILKNNWKKYVKLDQKWLIFADFWYSAYRPARPNIRPNNIGRNCPNIRPNIRYRSYTIC